MKTRRVTIDYTPGCLGLPWVVRIDGRFLNCFNTKWGAKWYARRVRRNFAAAARIND